MWFYHLLYAAKYYFFLIWPFLKLWHPG